jgi:hypothetical protein
VSANERQVGGDHYKRLVIQPWDFIEANGLGYLEGCIVKYVCRWREKGGVADLRKARHYVDKLLELAEKPGALEAQLRATCERIKARAGAGTLPVPPADAPVPPKSWSDAP